MSEIGTTCARSFFYLPICRWYSLTQLDGSVSELSSFFRESGIQGLIHQWPKATPEVWKILALVGSLQAFLQVAVPGQKFLGPVSPKGNTPVYKVRNLVTSSS